MRSSKWWVRRNRISADAYIPGAVVVETASTTDQDRGSLDDLTKAELVERAEAAGLDTSGTKAELVERLGGGSDG